MKTHIKLLVLLLIALMLVQSTLFTAFAIEPIDIDTGIYQASGQPSKYSSQYNSGQRDVIATTLDGTSASTYYTGTNVYDVLSEKSASAIQSALATLMKTTHTYTSSYNDCHYKADRTDCENEDGRVSLIYTSYSATMSQWNGWNREHVWPQSLGGGNTSGGGADLHHIRPSDAVVNSTRGNKKYGNTNGGTAKYGSNPATGCLGGYYNSTYFEPLDNVKGDVARICLYVWVRWGSAWGADSVTEVFQSVDVLLDWMELDPVDTWELGRNEVVQDIQGNRNVFIDYPEYAWLIFGKEIPSDMVTPSGEASGGGHHWNSGTISVQATCTSAGVKLYTCTDSGCGETKTEAIPALGHSYSAWVIDTDATETSTGSKHRTCSTCKNTETAIIPIVGHTHSYTSVVVKPTCTSKGYTTYSCTCGDTYQDNFTNIIAHDYAAGRCLVCGYLDPNSGITYYTATDFINAVNTIMNSNSVGEERYSQIRNAAIIYNSLADEDKSVVSSKYNVFKGIIEEYNNGVNIINSDAEAASEAFVGAIAISASAILFALVGLITKKYI